MHIDKMLRPQRNKRHGDFLFMVQSAYHIWDAGSLPTKDYQFGISAEAIRIVHHCAA